MTWNRWTLAILLAAVLSADASAQIIGVPVLVPSGGVEFQAGGKHLKIDGFIPIGNPYLGVLPLSPSPFGWRQAGPVLIPYGPSPYGVVDQRVTVQIINPPGLVRRAGYKPVYDVSGIDLDVESSAKIWGPKPDAKKGELVKAPMVEPKKLEIVKAESLPEKKPAVKEPEVVKLPKVPEGRRLNDLGVDAFRNGEYGLALVRFRQAVDVEPPEPRALFLRGQAYLAVGKYRDAVEIIRRGLQIMPDWPLSGFQPRNELYADDANLWKQHRRRLEETHRLNPNDADYLFLLGYLYWFDGERGVAADYFQQSRAQAADPRWSDAFLKAAKK
jgi:Tetratricopeptide repeat